MTARDFCYWLQGMFELAPTPTLDAKQTDLVRRHLALVFQHDIDPSAGGPAQQAILNQIHAGLAGQEAKPEPPQIGGKGPGGVVYRC